MNKPLVSVIIPIYKVERFLPKCLDSVTNQSYTNLDIILVDDGSPDDCGKICDEYASKDKRIKIIHKKNEGLARARLSGYKLAKGEYVLFVDSDDYIPINAIEIYVKYATTYNTDLVVSRHYIQISDKLIPDIRTSRLGLYDKNEINELLKTIFLFDSTIGKSGFPLYQWGKLIKKECMKGCIEQGFDVFAEDLISIFCTLQKISSMLLIEDNLYYYVSHENQITKKNSEDLWPAFLKTWKKLKEIDSNNILKYQLPERIISCITSTLISISLRKTFKYYRGFIINNVHEDFIEELIWSNKNVILHSITAKIYYTLLRKKLYFISYLIGKFNLIDKAVWLKNLFR